MSVAIYGIKNCDTMKKALAWLDARRIAYVFHDYKKTGADKELLEQAVRRHGWEQLVNRKGTSWRALPDEVKSSMDAAGAVEAALANPSLIRRPLLVHEGRIHLGFSESEYAALFERS